MNHHTIGNIPALPNKFLGYGVKFTPVPKINKKTILEEADKFIRLLRIKWKFQDDENDITSEQLRYKIPNPAYMPPKATAELERLFETFRVDLHHQIQRVKSLKIDYRQAHQLNDLKHFLKNHDLVVRTADKNLGLTIMTKKWYNQESLRQLNNEKLYKQLSQEQLMEKLFHVNNSLQSIIENGFRNNVITQVEKKYLLSKMEQFKISTWYHIPKIHKQSEGKPITGRPITPSYAFITSPASRWISDQLKQVVNLHQHVLKDTTTFINFIDQKRINENAILFTADVESLYPNIPWDYGLSQIARYWLQAFPNLKIEMKFILSLLKLTNENNLFHYESKYFQQLSGTAMGYSHGPQFANISLLEVDSTATRISSELGNESFIYDIGNCVWLRFIDDVFGVWNGTIESFNLFVDRVNNIHRSFKFNFVSSGTSIPFLDVHVFKITQNNTTILNVRTHQKVLNNYLYVPFNSFHPKSNKIAWIKTELFRYVRTCSQKEQYDEIKKAFLYRLLARGYPYNKLISIFQEVDHSMRDKLLEKKDMATRCTIPLIFKTEYNPIHHDIKLKALVCQLTDNCKNAVPETSKLFEEIPLICYKQPPSLLKLCNNIEKSKITDKSMTVRDDYKLWLSQKQKDYMSNKIKTLFTKGTKHIISSGVNQLSRKSEMTSLKTKMLTQVKNRLVIGQMVKNIIPNTNNDKKILSCNNEEIKLPNLNGMVASTSKDVKGYPQPGLLERLGYTKPSFARPPSPPRSQFQEILERIKDIRKSLEIKKHVATNSTSVYHSDDRTTVNSKFPKNQEITVGNNQHKVEKIIKPKFKFFERAKKS
jgi:hypothetical protein